MPEGGKNAIARELAELGRSDKRLVDRMTAAVHALEVNRARRCALLCEAAGMTELDGDVSAEVIEPKD